MKYDINKEILREDVFIGYKSGAKVLLKNGKLYRIQYNTKDWVWFDDEGEVVNVLTYDGVEA